mmetsp:Transcript_38818/g.48059  ORF Transcript_38818/g.48059 Transcript_38818/m.48059 type:complete len:142 (+) Transcript_38818:159-584(+)
MYDNKGCPIIDINLDDIKSDIDIWLKKSHNNYGCLDIENYHVNEMDYDHGNKPYFFVKNKCLNNNDTINTTNENNNINNNNTNNNSSDNINSNAIDIDLSSISEISDEFSDTKTTYNDASNLEFYKSTQSDISNNSIVSKQ